MNIYGADPDSHDYIKVSTDGGDTWDIVGDLCHDGDFYFPGASGGPGGYGWNWNEYPPVVNLSAYDGSSSLMVAWNYNSGGGDPRGIWMVDDVAFTGDMAGPDTTPPVTTCTLEGEMEDDVYVGNVTVTLTATDEQSGVNYTEYRLNDGENQTYTDPFVVSELGEHIVYYHSVDKAGNEEDKKNCTFTIRQTVSYSIHLSGGIGVNVRISNTGEVNITGLEYTITVDGNLIFVGKEKTGVVDIPVGESVLINSFVIGIGKAIVTATAGDVEESSNAIVILFFVFLY
ncbi:hypothetical protein ES703_59034 [subsurface metagenome]